MAGKSILIGALAVALCAPTSAAAEDFDLRMTLTIDGREVGQVRTGRDVRRLLARCSPPTTCKDIGLEREPQIWYDATFETRGYVVGHRSGPPGPLWDARRKGKGSATHFSTKEMIVITANFIEGKNTPFVRWKSTPLP